MPTTPLQTRPLGAQISHMLKSRGIDTIFGIPGVHNQEMYRGIEEAGITHVLARHEQGAGFMADGYARATGKPGVAYVITGPGLCNIMTPMGQAYSDSVPMLVISSCLDDTEGLKGQLHQMKDQRAAADTVCDWSKTATSAAHAYALIDQALNEFKTQRPRPKHITVPIALLEAEAPAPEIYSHTHTTLTPKAPLDTVIEQLNAAKRPLFIFGGAPHDYRQSRDIVKQLNALSFTTYAGRGVISDDDPLHMGATLSRPGSEYVISTADLVIVVGAELAQGDLWRENLGHTAPLIRVDIDATVLRDTHKANIRIQMRADDFIDTLHSAIMAQPIQTSDWKASEARDKKASWRSEVIAERPGLVPICDALKACLPNDTMIYSDMTQLAYVAKEVWAMEQPEHWHHPTGFGTLGYATPAAIGGAAARKGAPTLAIIGDYGFHYTMAELGVAVELGLNLPIILWDNGKLGEIEDSMTRAQIAPNAVVAYNPDFCKLAEAFGAQAVAPKTLKDMQTAVEQAFKANGPTLVYVTPAILEQGT